MPELDVEIDDMTPSLGKPSKRKSASIKKKAKTAANIASQASAEDLDELLREYLAKRRAMPGYTQRVAKLHETVASTISKSGKPSATLDPDDIDLIIGPSIPNPQADAELSRYLAARKKEPGYAKRVAALKRTIRKTEAATAKRKPGKQAKNKVA